MNRVYMANFLLKSYNLDIESYHDSSLEKTCWRATNKSWINSRWCITRNPYLHHTHTCMHAFIEMLGFRCLLNNFNILLANLCWVKNRKNEKKIRSQWRSFKVHAWLGNIKGKVFKVFQRNVLHKQAKFWTSVFLVAPAALKA